MKKYMLLMLAILIAMKISAQNNYQKIEIDKVITEIKQDSIYLHSIYIEGKYDYSVFYIDSSICIVHIFQHCSGVMDVSVQRYYKLNEGQWIFVRESSSFFSELEQIGNNLFHAYMYKGSSTYEAHRYESVMLYDNFEMKPLFEYDGVDYTYYLLNQYANEQIDYFNSCIGDTICDDYEVSNINIENNVLKSYKLKHTIKILQGINEEGTDLVTQDFINEHMIFANRNNIGLKMQ